MLDQIALGIQVMMKKFNFKAKVRPLDLEHIVVIQAAFPQWMDLRLCQV